MADDATSGATTTDAAADTGNAAAKAGNGTGGQTFTQEQVNDLVARERGKVQSKYQDYDELKAAATRLSEIEESKKTTEEKLQSERDALRGQTETLSQANARLRVALAKGLVGDKAELADRLVGKDEKEMSADADRLLALFGNTASTDFDGGARGGTPRTGDMNEFIRRGAKRNKV